MAIKGTINIEGLEITGSYTNITNFAYRKDSSDNYNIQYLYSIYVDENHRNSGKAPLHTGQDTVIFNDNSPIDPFKWMYGHLKSNKYFTSGSSLIDY